MGDAHTLKNAIVDLGQAMALPTRFVIHEAFKQRPWPHYGYSFHCELENVLELWNSADPHVLGLDRCSRIVQRCSHMLITSRSYVKAEAFPCLSNFIMLSPLSKIVMEGKDKQGSSSGWTCNHWLMKRLSGFKG